MTAITPLVEQRPAATEPALARQSPMARALYHRLCDAAAAGEPCPSNVSVMVDLDIAGPDTIRKLMWALSTAGLIAVETKGNTRRVTIPATGRTTGWTQMGRRTGLGAASVNDWTPDLDARLLAMAAEGLDHATIAQRLNRTSASVKHRLYRLTGGSAAAPPTSASAPMLPQARRTPARPRTRPVRADIVTTDDHRPQAERDQIAAFLAQRGDSVVVPAMFAAETTSAHDLAPVNDPERLRRLCGQVRHVMKGARFRALATVIVNLEGAVEASDIDAMVQRSWIKRWVNRSTTYIALAKGAPT